MKLIQNWRTVLGGAWSVYLMIAATLFSVISVFLSYTTAQMLGLSPVVFAAIAAVVGALAPIARILQQVAITGVIQRFRSDEAGWIRLRKRTVAPIAAVSLAAVVAFTGPWEGLRTSAYIDLVGVPTVCYGETKGVQLGDDYTPAECEAMLASRVGEFRDRLGECITVEVPEGVAVVFVDWSYNVGIGAACSSTLARKANAGDLFGACDELLKWNKGRINGKLQVIRGLANRREAERVVCVKSLIDAGYPRPAR